MGFSERGGLIRGGSVMRFCERGSLSIEFDDGVSGERWSH